MSIIHQEVGKLSITAPHKEKCTFPYLMDNYWEYFLSKEQGLWALHGVNLEFLIGLILCRSYASKDRCCESTGATAMCFIAMSSVINRYLAEMSLKTQGVIRGGGETFCTAGKLNSFRKSMKLTRFTCLLPSSNELAVKTC